MKTYQDITPPISLGTPSPVVPQDAPAGTTLSGTLSVETAPAVPGARPGSRGCLPEVSLVLDWELSPSA